MKICFDYQIFYLQKYGGISRYFYELSKALNKLSNCEVKIAAPFNSNEYLTNKDIQSSLLEANPLLKKLYHNKLLDKRVLLNESTAKKFCDAGQQVILHETYYTHRFQVKAPKVITIHDMIYELFSKQSPGEEAIIRAKKQAIRESDAIIAVSENTKKDLLHFYPEVTNKTFVVHHGLTPVSVNQITFYKHNKPYILFVGNRDWYKNFDLLLEVYSANKDLQNDFDIIAFGGGVFSSEENAAIKKANLLTQVIQVSGSDVLLNQLYKGASVLAYLSKYEGFGFPVLEAMNLNCPVICSNSSSLPEVAGNHALMIDVSKREEVEKALKTIPYTKQKDAHAIEAAKQWANTFTWETCAFETQKVYSTLLRK